MQAVKEWISDFWDNPIRAVFLAALLGGAIFLTAALQQGGKNAGNSAWILITRGADKSPVVMVGDFRGSIALKKTIEGGDPERYTDIDFFACTDRGESVSQATALAEILRQNSELGGIRVYSLEPQGGVIPKLFADRTTLIYDADLDEKGDLGKVLDYLANQAATSGLPPMQVLVNEGAATQWYFSILVC